MRRRLRAVAADRRGRVGAVLVVVGLLVAAYLLGVAVAAPTAPLGDADPGLGVPAVVGTQDDRGHVVAYGPNGTERWNYAAPDGAMFDVTRHGNGTVLAGYGSPDVRDCTTYESPCGRTGTRLIRPPTTPGGEPTVVADHGVEVRTKTNSEIHDVEPLPGGGVVYADMERERVVVAPRVGAEPEWVWNASAHYEPPADPTRRDWLHVNDVDRIGEGRYLVSVRNANQLLVVERGAGVVETINADRDDTDDDACRQFDRMLVPGPDGDVRCGDPDVLDAQHNPQWLGDGAVLVADSHNDRVVELHRTDDGTWRVAWANYGAGGVTYDWPRDADRLPNGHTVVSDTWNRRVVVVDEDGEAVGAVTTPPMVYEADPYGGETVGGPTLGSLDDPPASGGGDLPVFARFLGVLRHVVALPWWFQEGHLLALVGGLGAAAVGAGMVVVVAREAG
jgi:hypothetical protein